MSVYLLYLHTPGKMSVYCNIPISVETGTLSTQKTWYNYNAVDSGTLST